MREVSLGAYGNARTPSLQDDDMQHQKLKVSRNSSIPLLWEDGRILDPRVPSCLDVPYDWLSTTIRLVWSFAICPPWMVISLNLVRSIITVVLRMVRTHWYRAIPREFRPGSCRVL